MLHGGEHEGKVGDGWLIIEFVIQEQKEVVKVVVGR